MSEIAQKILEVAQRECGWCNEEFDSIDALCNHILDNHMSENE